MHAGNIFMALLSWLVVKSLGGTIVLRIEDLDVERSKPRFSDALLRDFERLGLTWDRGPYYQADRFAVYEEAFAELKARGLVYPCFCTRADLAALRAPHHGELPVYPGTCRALNAGERKRLQVAGKRFGWRVRVPHATIAFTDGIQGRYAQELSSQCGDFLLRRADGLFAYQLAVVIDDADQGVNCIVRGCDLLPSTPRQIYLRALLHKESGPGEIHYVHGPLLVNESGRRLSKRDSDASLDVLLERYKTPEAVIGAVAGRTGLAESEEPTTPEELLSAFDPKRLATMFPDPIAIRWS